MKHTIRAIPWVAITLLLTAIAVIAQEAAPAAPATAAAPPEWLVGIVPIFLFLVKQAALQLPDALIKRIRDEWIPWIAVAGGVGLTSAQTGEIDWSQGVVVGLAGVGIHQLLKQMGALDAIFGRKLIDGTRLKNLVLMVALGSTIALQQGCAGFVNDIGPTQAPAPQNTEQTLAYIEGKLAVAARTVAELLRTGVITKAQAQEARAALHQAGSAMDLAWFYTRHAHVDEAETQRLVALRFLQEAQCFVERHKTPNSLSPECRKGAVQ